MTTQTEYALMSANVYGNYPQCWVRSPISHNTISPLNSCNG